MYYVDTLKRELIDTNAYKPQTSLSKRVVVDRHGCHTVLYFGVKAKTNQDKVSTLYWLPKLHRTPIKQDLLLILVLVRQQNFQKFSIKNSGEVLDKLKARDFNATNQSSYDFSTLYTTLQINLIKDKLIDLIERFN